MTIQRFLPRFISRRILFERKMIQWPGIFELSFGQWALALELINAGTDSDYRWPWMLRVSILPVALYLHLPLPRRVIALDWQGFPRYGEQDSWGVAFHFMSGMRDMHARWGRRCFIWEYPFANWVHLRTEVRRPDGSWVPEVNSWEEKGRSPDGLDWRGNPLKDPDGREYQTFPYRYVLENGDIQNVNAKVSAHRYVRRRKWLTWTKLFEWTDNSIGINFDDEVGERRGSWEGGCLGCGWSMLPNETVESAIRRMEAERKFR